MHVYVVQRKIHVAGGARNVDNISRLINNRKSIDNLHDFQIHSHASKSTCNVDPS